MGGGGTAEGIYMAGFGRFKVLSVDYRRPPAAFYPAALDDVVNAWKGAVKMANPKNMGIFGLSAGGALVAFGRPPPEGREGARFPAAIAPGTPMADLTGVGDSFHTNHMVDNVLVGVGRCDAMAEYYAQRSRPEGPDALADLRRHARLSADRAHHGHARPAPQQHERVHRKLRQAGVVAELHVFEGQAHAQYNRDTPEGKEAYEEIAAFFDRHLGK